MDPPTHARTEAIPRLPVRSTKQKVAMLLRASHCSGFLGWPSLGGFPFLAELCKEYQPNACVLLVFVFASVLVSAWLVVLFLLRVCLWCV